MPDAADAAVIGRLSNLGRFLPLLIAVAMGAGLAHVLIEQVLEHRVRTLVAHGTDVGQVVGDGVQLRLLRIQAGLGDPK